LCEGITFIVIRHDSQPAGCGGIQLDGSDYGKLKRMYVRSGFRGLGLAKRMVEHLAAFAGERSVHVLGLETGICQREAVGLCEGMEFLGIGPFGS